MKNRTKTPRNSSSGYYVYNFNATSGMDFNRIIRGEVSFLYYLKWGAILAGISASLAFGAYYLSHKNYHDFNIFGNSTIQRESSKGLSDKVIGN